MEAVEWHNATANVEPDDVLTISTRQFKVKLKHPSISLRLLTDLNDKTLFCFTTTVRQTDRQRSAVIGWLKVS